MIAPRKGNRIRLTSDRNREEQQGAMDNLIHFALFLF